MKFGIELGKLTGKSRKTTFNDGISISFACTVYIDYVSSHLRIWFKEFQICRFRTSRIYSTGSALESEWAKKPGVDTFVILFPIADSSGRDNPLEIYHIGYIFRTGR